MTNKERKGWRTVRVVVEVPVQGDYSEKDLRWDVIRCIEERMSIRFRDNRLARFGTPRVKEYARMMQYRGDKNKLIIHRSEAP